MATIEKNYEVDNRTGLNHEGLAANTPVRRLTATSIIGDRVENEQGDNLGKVENLMVNLHDGSIEYAVIDFGSFLGMGGKLFAIPFSELHIDEERELFIVRRNKEYLKQIPGFDKNHWPDTNDHSYFNDVNMYWGSTYAPQP
jgi:sporulation protein YlmC with PRC-barrel domain